MRSSNASNDTNSARYRKNASLEISPMLALSMPEGFI